MTHHWYYEVEKMLKDDEVEIHPLSKIGMSG